MIRKLATLAVLDAWQIPAGATGLQKYAHRVDFDYAPRPGMLYVRSRAISSRANDNHDQFPADEIAASYKTFLGKPVFVNHHNANHRRARGVVVAVALHRDRNPDGTPDTWAEALMEVDAVRFPKLARAIIEGRVNRTSMGVDVEESECTACGNKATDPAQYCFPMGTMVALADGTHKPIEQMKLGDQVLTHDGIGEVTHLFERPYDGDVVTLTRSGMNHPVTLTANHGAMVSREGTSDGQWGRMEAGLLRKGDWVQVAHPVTEQDFEIDVLGLSDTFEERADGRVYAKRGLNGLDRFIRPSEALSGVLGLYLAEGNLQERRADGAPKVVAWTLASKEGWLADKLQVALDKLGAGKARRYPAKSVGSMSVRVNNIPLAMLLSRLGGNGSRHKVLAPEIMLMPPEHQRTLVDSFMDGDGWLDVRRGKKTGRTSSDDLARQLAQIGYRLGELPVVFRSNNPGGPGHREKSFTTNAITTAESEARDRHWLRDGYHAAKVVKADREHFKGTVYNIEVTGQHTYAVNGGMVVFNCKHLPALKGRKIRRRNPKTGKLEEEIIREICRGLSFFENSLLVEEPADPTAFVLGTPDSRGLKMAASRKTADLTRPHPSRMEMRSRGQEGGCRLNCTYGGTHCALCHEQVRVNLHKPDINGGWHHADGMKRDHEATPADPQRVMDSIPGQQAAKDQAKRQMGDFLHGQFEQLSGHPLPRRSRGDEDQMPLDPFLSARHTADTMDEEVEPSKPDDPVTRIMRHLEDMHGAPGMGAAILAGQHFERKHGRPIHGGQGEEPDKSDVRAHTSWMNHYAQGYTDLHEGLHMLHQHMHGYRPGDLDTEHTWKYPDEAGTWTPSLGEHAGQEQGFAHRHTPLDPLVAPGKQLGDWHDPTNKEYHFAPSDSRVIYPLGYGNHDPIPDYYKQQESKYRSPLHPERTDEYPNRQAGDEGEDWKFRGKGNMSSCSKTYSSDEQSDAADKSRKFDKQRPERQEGETYQEHSKKYDRWRGRLENSGALCPECGVYKYMHAYHKPSEVGRPVPAYHERAREEWDRQMKDKTAPFIPEKQHWSSRRTAELSDEDIQRGLHLPGSAREEAHEEGSELGRKLYQGYMDIAHPGDTEESLKATDNLRAHDYLMNRYGEGKPGGHHGFDEEEESPYYEIKHRHPQTGRPTGWTIRHYMDGPHAEIRHEATPQESHDAFEIGENNPHQDTFGWHHPHPGFGHQNLEGILNNFYGDDEGGAREYLEGPGGDPRIRRWKMRHGAALRSEASPRYQTAEDHPFFQANPVDHRNIVGAYHDSTDDERSLGHRWYSDAHHVAKAIAGGDIGRGAGLVAAYSPRTSWPVNLFNASKAHRENRAFGGPGDGAMGMHKNLAAPIIAGMHHSAAFRDSAPKIGEFAHLIEHAGDTEEDRANGTERVVVDRHALSAAIGHRVSTNDLEKAPIDKRPYYDHVAHAYRQAARELSDHFGTYIAPHQVQATVWLRQIRANQAEDAAQSFGGRGRIQRGRNAQETWNEHARQHYNDIPQGNMHIGTLENWPRTRGEAAQHLRDVHDWDADASNGKDYELLHDNEHQWARQNGQEFSHSHGAVEGPAYMHAGEYREMKPSVPRGRALSVKHVGAADPLGDLPAPAPCSYCKDSFMTPYLRDLHERAAHPAESGETGLSGSDRAWLREHRIQGSLRPVAYGETKVPQQVNTLRQEECPVCNESQVWTGQRCPVCGYVAPPSLFRDPDTQKAMQVRDELDATSDDQMQNQGLEVPPAGQGSWPASDQQMFHPDQLAPNGVPGVAPDNEPDDQDLAGEGGLVCPDCGTEFGPDEDLAPGDPCPSCGQGILEEAEPEEGLEDEEEGPEALEEDEQESGEPGEEDAEAGGDEAEAEAEEEAAEDEDEEEGDGDDERQGRPAAFARH